MSPRIPPFAAIRAFESAARHCNLRLSSEELFLSISAVSHQIKSLEQHLSVALFDRSKNSLQLTPAGAIYSRKISKALDLIYSATAETVAVRDANDVTINLYPSLAVMWLMPALAHFYEMFPQIQVNVLTSIEPMSFRSGDLNLALRYEPTQDIPGEVPVLFDETIYPVCTPEYAERLNIESDHGAYRNATLIHCQTSHDEWDIWFDATGNPGTESLRILNVDNRALALRAAENGLGIAMGRTPYVTGLLEEGRLVRVDRKQIVTGYSYSLYCSDSSIKSPATQTFLQWLTNVGEG
jgi:DNA-binding transcriptional LysR family regulator